MERSDKALPYTLLSKPCFFLCHPPWSQETGPQSLPHFLTFTAEAFLHPTEPKFLMQEFLLPAVLTLGYHTPKPLEVLTAITAAELEDLVLRRKHRTGRIQLGHLHLKGTARKDFFKHVARCGWGDLTCHSKTSGLPLKRLWQ